MLRNGYVANVKLLFGNEVNTDSLINKTWKHVIKSTQIRQNLCCKCKIYYIPSPISAPKIKITAHSLRTVFVRSLRKTFGKPSHEFESRARS